MYSVHSAVWTIKKHDSGQMKTASLDEFLLNNSHLQQVLDPAVEHGYYGLRDHHGDCFLKTQQYLLSGDGPLPFTCRHFIAIMAARQRQCPYLIELHTAEFLLHGGHESWLTAPESVPQKILDLDEINSILANRPWQLTSFHIAKLRQCPGSWSLSELMQAIVILVHIHSLSSFIAGCETRSFEDQESSDDTSLDESDESTSRPCQSFSELNAVNSYSQQGIKKNTAEFPHSLSNEPPAASLADSTPTLSVLGGVDYPDVTYQQITEKTKSHSELTMFAANDYSWQDHGYSLANRLYTDIGNYLDDEFRVGQNLQFYVSSDNGNPSKAIARGHAVWKYIHCQLGMTHDDYDYSLVNTLLTRPTKTYIKTLACFPERLSHTSLSTVLSDIPISERINLNVLVLEARQQVELLYSLRAIDKNLSVVEH